MNRLFCFRKALLTGAAITVAVNSGIAAVLWLSRLGSFAEQMVYSQAIGLSIWALVNGGAGWLSRPTDPGGFPRGFRTVVLVPSATLLGIANGTWLGDLYSGRSSWALGAQSPKLAGLCRRRCVHPAAQPLPGAAGLGPVLGAGLNASHAWNALP